MAPLFFMEHDLKHRTRDEIKAYFDGARAVLYAYAVHKDGVMYVGCGNYTYRTAVELLNTQEQVAIDCALDREAQERETKQIIAQRQERE